MTLHNYKANPLSGVLVITKNKTGVITVPQKLIDGVFSALEEPGLEKITKNTPDLTSDIVVFTKEEIERIGSDNLKERGNSFNYKLGNLKRLIKKNPLAHSYALWAFEVKSDELKNLRKRYGLSEEPRNGFIVPIAIYKFATTKCSFCEKGFELKQKSIDKNPYIISKKTFNIGEIVKPFAGIKFKIAGIIPAIEESYFLHLLPHYKYANLKPIISNNVVDLIAIKKIKPGDVLSINADDFEYPLSLGGVPYINGFHPYYYWDNHNLMYKNAEFTSKLKLLDQWLFYLTAIVNHNPKNLLKLHEKLATSTRIIVPTPATKEKKPRFRVSLEDLTGIRTLLDFELFGLLYPILNLAALPLFGMVFPGVGGEENVLNRLRAMSIVQSVLKPSLGALDIGNMEETLKSWANMLGFDPNDPNVQQFASNVSKAVTGVTPYLASFFPSLYGHFVGKGIGITPMQLAQNYVATIANKAWDPETGTRVSPEQALQAFADAGVQLDPQVIGSLSGKELTELVASLSDIWRFAPKNLSEYSMMINMVKQMFPTITAPYTILGPVFHPIPVIPQSQPLQGGIKISSQIEKSAISADEAVNLARRLGLFELPPQIALGLTAAITPFAQRMPVDEALSLIELSKQLDLPTISPLFFALTETLKNIGPLTDITKADLFKSLAAALYRSSKSITARISHAILSLAPFSRPESPLRHLAEIINRGESLPLLTPPEFVQLAADSGITPVTALQALKNVDPKTLLSYNPLGTYSAMATEFVNALLPSALSLGSTYGVDPNTISILVNSLFDLKNINDPIKWKAELSANAEQLGIPPPVVAQILTSAEFLAPKMFGMPLRHALILFNPNVVDAIRKMYVNAQSESLASVEMSSLLWPSMIRRLSKKLYDITAQGQQVWSLQNLLDLFGTALGGVKVNDIADILNKYKLPENFIPGFKLSTLSP